MEEEELRLTFSVRVTLRRLRVENPEEHSVSVGELGHEWVSNRPPTPLWPPLWPPLNEAACCFWCAWSAFALSSSKSSWMSSMSERWLRYEASQPITELEDRYPRSRWCLLLRLPEPRRISQCGWVASQPELLGMFLEAAVCNQRMEKSDEISVLIRGWGCWEVRGHYRAASLESVVVSNKGCQLRLYGS